MAIYLQLQTNGMPANEVACIVNAYERTLYTLCFRDGDDPFTEMIAKAIIKFAQTGIKDPAQISALAIEELELR